MGILAGAVFSAGQLGTIARVLVEFPEVWVMSDDAYEHIGYVGRIPHIFEVEPRLKQHGIVFNTLSKAYAMTGWRIGFAAGPREAIGAATRLQSQNSGNPNSIAQAAAVEALTGPQDEIATMAAEFRARREPCRHRDTQNENELAPRHPVTLSAILVTGFTVDRLTRLFPSCGSSWTAHPPA